MQASNFVGTFDQLVLWIFMKFSQKTRLYFFYTMMQKGKKWPKTQIKGVLQYRVMKLWWFIGGEDACAGILGEHALEAIQIYQESNARHERRGLQ